MTKLIKNLDKNMIDLKKLDKVRIVNNDKNIKYKIWKIRKNYKKLLMKLSKNILKNFY